MSRTLLSSIRTLTFYDGAQTSARRGKPIPQLTCIGAACDLYRPDVVRCTNAGGEGADVDWKCEADLPEALRLGRVEVSCEGWARPGDPYVYRESCGLEYRLVHVPAKLRNDHYDPYASRPRAGLGEYAFFALFAAILLFILYNFFASCMGARPQGAGAPRRPGGGGLFPGFGGGGGAYPGGTDDDAPPPPYVPYPKPGTSTSTDAAGAGRAGGVGGVPGMLAGAALGGLGTYLATRGRNGGARADRQQYDWEREREGRRAPARGFGGGRRFDDEDDRGVGSSSGLGEMRRSTGFGGSSVR